MKEKKNRLILRRKSNGTVKAVVYIRQPTTVLIYKQAKKLAEVFGRERYCFDVTDFAGFYL